jgi:hypothetical protein
MTPLLTAREVFLLLTTISLQTTALRITPPDDYRRRLLPHIEYAVQAMTSAIAAHGETLAPLMRTTGFRYIFLGIENVDERDLTFLQAVAKNRLRKNGAGTSNATIKLPTIASQRNVRCRRSHRLKSGRYS